MNFKPGDVLDYQGEVIQIIHMIYSQGSFFFEFDKYPLKKDIKACRRLGIHHMDRLAKLYIRPYNRIWYDLNETSI